MENAGEETETESESESESELVRRAMAGDDAAGRRLLVLHAPKLLKSAMVLARDPHLAEDITQESLIEAMNSLDRFDGRCLFATWLHGILRHRYLKSLRADRRIPTPIDEGSLLWVSGGESDPSLGLHSAEESAFLRQEVAALADTHREVIELRFFAEASLGEIAAALDIPVGTVKSRLHHALEKLRQSQAVRTGLDRPAAIGLPPRYSLEDPIR